MSHLLDGRDQDVWAMGEQGCSAGTKSGLFILERSAQLLALLLLHPTRSRTLSKVPWYINDTLKGNPSDISAVQTMEMMKRKELSLY